MHSVCIDAGGTILYLIQCENKSTLLNFRQKPFYIKSTLDLHIILHINTLSNYLLTSDWKAVIT